MNIKCKEYYPAEWSQTTRWCFDEFPDYAITYQLTMSAQPAVGEAEHDRQNAFLTAIYTVSEDIVTKCGFNLR